MSKKKDGLIEILADYFWSYKSYELDGVLKGYGISPDETLNPNSSKKVYARSGLVKMTEEGIVELSKREMQRVFLLISRWKNILVTVYLNLPILLEENWQNISIRVRILRAR